MQLQIWVEIKSLPWQTVWRSVNPAPRPVIMFGLPWNNITPLGKAFNQCGICWTLLFSVCWLFKLITLLFPQIVGAGPCFFFYRTQRNSTVKVPQLHPWGGHQWTDLQGCEPSSRQAQAEETRATQPQVESETSTDAQRRDRRDKWW